MIITEELLKKYRSNPHFPTIWTLICLKIVEQRGRNQITQ